MKGRGWVGQGQHSEGEGFVRAGGLGEAGSQMQRWVPADTWGAPPTRPSRSPPPGGALTGSSGGRLSFSSSWEGATPNCWTSAWSWVRRGKGRGEGEGEGPPRPLSGPVHPRRAGR